jgi:tRNA1(Val) A37 N6-methylase TrmN6
MQPSQGYRFNSDSVLLARFLPEELPGRAADLGAGCGVVGLEALAQGHLRGLKTLYLVEAATLFRESLLSNIENFSLPHGPKILPLMADWRFLSAESLGGPLDYLAVNPPYFQVGSSGQPKPGRNQGRHETMGDLGDLLKAARKLLAPGGGLAISWPRARLGRLVSLAGKVGFVPARFHFPPRKGSGLILAEFRS